MAVEASLPTTSFRILEQLGWLIIFWGPLSCCDLGVKDNGAFCFATGKQEGRGKLIKKAYEAMITCEIAP